MRSREPGPSTPLTDPRSLGSSVAFHVLLLLAGSAVVLGVAVPSTQAPAVIHAELGPVDNRAPAEAGGGGPGPMGGTRPPEAFKLGSDGQSPEARAGRDPAASISTRWWDSTATACRFAASF